jgi:D-alanyl-lipoteichoic acid acyltransferase DltB (MBOAT superfamily)
LFVTFFPQLIAGPIVHHREMMPQFVKDHIYSINYKFITTGLSIFSIGLFKKVMIADSMALYATPVFTAAAEGTALSFFEAWFGSLAYTFQLYFDFSGYSDMAIGLAFLFGIRLPANFYSPYKAVNIIDFWRRWHITLSRFLLFYLYIPLGGNRKGQIHRYFNLMITMVLGGLWHGAALNFVFWGTLHGFFLAINHAWHGFRRILGHNLKKSTRLGRCMSQIFTFSLLVITWVFFRAESFDSAMSMVKAMMGHNGLSLPASFQGAMGNFVPFLLENGVIFNGLFYNGIIGNLNIVFWFFALFIIVWYFPNTQQFMAEHSPALDIYHRDVSDSINKRLIWQPTYKWALLMATMTTITIIGLSRASEFIYFQF